jgi:hypothetical protein
MPLYKKEEIGNFNGSQTKRRNKLLPKPKKINLAITKKALKIIKAF